MLIFSLLLGTINILFVSIPKANLVSHSKAFLALPNATFFSQRNLLLHIFLIQLQKLPIPPPPKRLSLNRFITSRKAIYYYRTKYF